MTDSEIIRGIKDNSESAWREAYVRFKPAIRMQVAPLLRNVKDVSFDDVYEDGLMALMENIKDGKLREEDSNLAGYLFTICRRIALKHYRRKTILGMDEGQTLMPAQKGGFVVIQPRREDEEQVDPDVLSEEERYAKDFLDRVLDSLPESCRKILKRFYWDRMPMDMIAPLMGLKNANTAKTTKKRCMDKYKELAKQMLADDEKAERAVRRSVERNALRDLLEQFRKEDDGSLAMAACRNTSTSTDSDDTSTPES